MTSVTLRRIEPIQSARERPSKKLPEIRTNVSKSLWLRAADRSALESAPAESSTTRPQRLFGTYVKANMPGFAAIMDGVTPASVRLSPCESEIVRPEAFLVAWDITAARSSACVMPGVR
jgi:hypothetical protein